MSYDPMKFSKDQIIRSGRGGKASLTKAMALYWYESGMAQASASTSLALAVVPAKPKTNQNYLRLRKSKY